jgi:hypothetical protein
MARKPLCYPDFILIGAPNAGGDIIKTALSRDPHIWFPPLDNILAFHPGFQVARFDALQRFFNGKLTYNPKDLKWLLRYFLKASPNPTWYGKLFWTKDDTLLKGEFSDEYINLPYDQVGKLYKTIPECKIVVMLRDPVERSYAAIREKFADNPKMPYSQMSKRQIVTIMNSDWARTHSAYQNAIDGWVVFYPQDQIYIGFYEELLEDPEKVINEIRAFIGCEPVVLKDKRALLGKAQPSFPDSLLKNLHSFYRIEAKGLAHRLGSYAEAWFARHPVPEIIPEPPPKTEEELAAEAAAEAAVEEVAEASPDANAVVVSPLVEFLRKLGIKPKDGADTAPAAPSAKPAGKAAAKPATPATNPADVGVSPLVLFIRKVTGIKAKDGTAAPPAPAKKDKKK